MNMYENDFKMHGLIFPTLEFGSLSYIFLNTQNNQKFSFICSKNLRSNLVIILHIIIYHNSLLRKKFVMFGFN